MPKDLSIVHRKGHKRRSKTLRLRTRTTQEHINTPGKFHLFYFSIWCILFKLPLKRLASKPPQLGSPVAQSRTQSLLVSYCACSCSCCCRCCSCCCCRSFEYPFPPPLPPPILVNIVMNDNLTHIIFIALNHGIIIQETRAVWRSEYYFFP